MPGDDVQRPSRNWNRANVVRAQEWRSRLLAKVEAGERIYDVLRQLGVTEANYQRSRTRHPRWAAEVSAASERRRADTKFERAEIRKTDPRTLSHAQWAKVYLRFDSDWLQLRIADELDATLAGEVTMLNCFPEAGKSTALGCWMTRKLAEDPNHRIAVVTAGQELAVDLMGRVQRRLEPAAFDEFRLLHERYGPFKEVGRDGRPWNAQSFTVLKATHDEADPTVRALGWTSKAYGRRFDTLIIDDVQDEGTIGQTDKIYARLRSVYFSRGKNMRIFVVGSRQGPGDIYERMLDDGIVDHYFSYTCADHEGHPTVPDAWRYPRVTNNKTAQENMDAKRRLVGDRAWAANYQQNPVTDELSTFAAYIDGSLDLDRRVGELGRWAA